LPDGVYDVGRCPVVPGLKSRKIFPQPYAVKQRGDAPDHDSTS
jgi:hypothetical protein